jgi:DNA-binding SARP family transcriptional activator/tetratricopeptide (TPR) repeat protein
LRLLGPLELSCAGEVVEAGGAKPRALLAYLALHLGQVLSVDQLVDDLWGEGAPQAAAHAVQVYIARMRKKLGPARTALVTRGPGYALQLEPDQVDLHRFSKLADEGRFREALALWRGPALADCRYEPFAQGEIRRLEELRLRCLEGRIEADLESGRHAEVVAELEAMVAAEPLRERLRALLMLALYRSGRQSDALAAYRAARQTLVDELGIEPGPELRALETAILRQDESLRPQTSEPAEPRPPRRKLATILFTRIADPAALTETHDEEEAHNLLARYFETVEAAVTRHGGTIEQAAGSTAMAVFGIPVAHEDDPLRAARAAIELLAGAAELALQVRICLETGEVLGAESSAGHRLVTGAAVSVGEQLQQATEPGHVVIGEGAARLLAHAAVMEPLVATRLPNSGSLPAYRLLSLVPAAPAVERRLDAALAGRREELAYLQAALADAIGTGRARGVVVSGAAGIGKSRLAEELARDAEALVLAGRCLSYGEGITYWPLRTMVAAEELEAIMVSPSAAEIAMAFRRYCERLAARKPVVLVLDDLHLAEPSFLELVEHVIERGDAPILVLALAREELREERPGFLSGGRLDLEGLAPDDAELLLADRMLSDATRARILEVAEGNPLFLEQLAAFAAEEGDLPEGRVPATVRALLAARLERLGPGERAVLERAAVIGREFAGAQVASLLEPGVAGTSGRHLQALTSRGFVRPGAEEEHRFRHGLIQDAVYRATPKAERALIHERYADTLEGDAEDLDELVGYHLEQAYHLRVELGANDRIGRQLATDAGTRLGAAGIRASKRADLPAAVNLLGRAVALLSTDTRPRAEFLCELGIALRAAGDGKTADEILTAARHAGNREVGLRAAIELAYGRLLSEPRRDAGELLEETHAAIPVFETLGDHRGLGRAWLLVGFVRGGLHGRHSAWEEAAERSLTHYRQAGWPTSTCLSQIAGALYYGPAHVERAVDRCEELLQGVGADASGEANVRAFLGGLLAMQGRSLEARDEIARATAIYGDLGQRYPAAVYAGAVLADVEFLQEDSPAAEEILRTACSALEEMSDLNHLATRAADLAEALYRQGKLSEADRWATVSAESAAPDDLDAQPLWRAVRAKLLARSGSLSDAESLARDAVALAERTEGLNRQARVLLDLAEVLRLAGTDAGEPIERAVAIFERKGNIVGISRARHAMTLGFQAR